MAIICIIGHDFRMAYPTFMCDLCRCLSGHYDFAVCVSMPFMTTAGIKFTMTKTSIYYWKWLPIMDSFTKFLQNDALIQLLVSSYQIVLFNTKLITDHQIVSETVIDY